MTKNGFVADVTLNKNIFKVPEVLRAKLKKEKTTKKAKKFYNFLSLTFLEVPIL